jgi:Skp family chaperone for outer membrane proteins
MGLLLKIKKSEMELQLQKAETVLARLEALRGKFQTLLNELNSDVLTGEDANFSLAEQMVQQNITATEEATKDAQKARSTFEETVKLYDENEAAGRAALQAGLQAAGDAIQAVVNANTVL